LGVKIEVAADDDQGVLILLPDEPGQKNDLVPLDPGQAVLRRPIGKVIGLQVGIHGHNLKAIHFEMYHQDPFIQGPIGVADTPLAAAIREWMKYPIADWSPGSGEQAPIGFANILLIDQVRDFRESPLQKGEIGARLDLL
jgi:hypothetical protein